MPLDVLLIPAKRTMYTANLYVSTDSGPGVRLGAQRRWLNKRGHKLGGEIEYSQRLQEISTNYRIPDPGPKNRHFDFGAGYRDEETDTSTSRMARLAATEVRDRWKGFTRTLGLQYLNGNFEIADTQGDTSLLYAEGLLTRRKADDPYFPTSGYSLLYGLRVATEALLSDTTLIQVRAEGKGLTKVGERGRFITRAALGAMAVDNFDALPPELRFFAGGDRSLRGFDYQQIGETNAAGGVIGGEYLAVRQCRVRALFSRRLGRRGVRGRGRCIHLAIRRECRCGRRRALEIAGRAGATRRRVRRGHRPGEGMADPRRDRARPVNAAAPHRQVDRAGARRARHCCRVSRHLDAQYDFRHSMDGRKGGLRYWATSSRSVRRKARSPDRSSCETSAIGIRRWVST